MSTDTIADMLTRIRNAIMVRHFFVKIRLSRMTFGIAQILYDEGYIVDFEVLQQKGKPDFLFLGLKYLGREQKPILHSIKRISKPGLRIYVDKRNLPTVVDNLGIAIISTSQGLMTNHRAKELGLGGEVICYIW